MSIQLLIIILVVLMALIGLVVMFLVLGAPLAPRKVRRQAQVSETLRSLVQAQRSAGEEGRHSKKNNLAVAAAAESQLNRKKIVSSSRLSVEKKLRYARWPITVMHFRAMQAIAASIFLIIVNAIGLGIAWKLVAPLMGFALVTGVLDQAVNKRFLAFDKDYPVLLLSYVSLLKTGMTTIAGLDAAAKGLDEGTLVRAEVQLLIERLRLGLTEEQAINAFGEDIAHPELELFVQSLLLSRKVGGQLSSTLERLAKQVRKRQQFRKQAVAKVGMERGSIYAISAIMSLLLAYLIFNSDLVAPAFHNEIGQKILQIGVLLVIVGFYWSRKVTNIKI